MFFVRTARWCGVKVISKSEIHRIRGQALLEYGELKGALKEGQLARDAEDGSALDRKLAKGFIVQVLSRMKDISPAEYEAVINEKTKCGPSKQ